MKICVFGLDCEATEVVFGNDRLVNLRRLMNAGVYGRLESVIPPNDREPNGLIPPGEYESFQDEMKARFEALTDHKKVNH